MNKIDFTAALIVPTGIGASIGGFAGDASPVVNLMSKICPIITNPNSVNAAVFSGINSEILYTEGYTIDLLFKNQIALRPSKHNKIGIIFDKAIPEDVINIHINTINAVKSVYGIDLPYLKITDEKVDIGFSISNNGISTGYVKNSNTLIKAAEELINQGANALAVVCYFDDCDEISDKNYASGIGVDPVGGVEAVISHLLTEKFRVPVAHAPAFSDYDISNKIVDKRAASEYITPTFLPCILLGLYNAPQIISIQESNIFDINLNTIKCLIMPYNSLGCIPVLKAIENQIQVIAVKDNQTVLDITPEAINFKEQIKVVNNYYEAAGYLLALKNGIKF